MKRRPNFTAAEMDALIEAISQRRAVVTNSGRVNKLAKEREWLSITAKVNEASALHRSVTEVRKKWKNLRMVTKVKKEAMLADIVQLCKTGMAPSGLRHLTPLETRVVQILDACGQEASVISSEECNTDVREESLSKVKEESNSTISDGEEEMKSNLEVITSSVDGIEIPDVADGSVVTKASSSSLHRISDTSPQAEVARSRQTKGSSIQSVVDALQRRREAEVVDKSVGVFGYAGEICSNAELLEIQQQLLQAERQKVVALREIVSTLREVAATVKAMLMEEQLQLPHS